MSNNQESALLQTISPIDDSVYVERALANEKDIEQSIALSRSAQKQWQTTSIVERASICELAVQYFESNQAQIAEEISWQMGRPLIYGGSEIGGLAERARYMINIAEEALADERPQAKQGFERFIRREALGVLLTVAPWN